MSILTTEIRSWFKTTDHEDPIGNTELIVLVNVFVFGKEVGYSTVSRPFAEIPYVTTFEDLKETQMWAEMVKEATDAATLKALGLLEALKEGLAA